MVNRTLTKKLLRDIYSRKGSLLSLLILLMIGSGCFVGMASVWRDLDGARREYYRDQRLADFWINLKRMPESEVESLRSTPNVASIEGRISMGALLDVDNENEPVSGTVISLPDRRSPVLNDVLLTSGVWFSSPDAREAILNESFARAHGIQPGDRIKVLLVDKQHDLLVVGTAMSPEFVYLLPPGGALAPDPAKFGVVYTSRTFLREASDLDGSFNEVVGTFHNRDAAQVESTLAMLARRIDRYGVIERTPVDNQPSYRFLADELSGLRVSSTIIPGIFLAVSALILHILLSRVIDQQRSIIGTLKAIGYSRAQVMRHYLGFGVALGLLAIIMGFLFGRWVQGGMISLYNQFYSLPGLVAHRYTDLNLLAAGLCMLFSCSGTLSAVWRASRLHPAEAMHPPPPEKGNRVLLERIPLLWNRLSFRPRMILRSVFRNPFRSIVNIVAAGVPTALVLATVTLNDSIYYMIDYQFSRVAHQDVSVSLRDPVGLEAVRMISASPSVREIEPQLGVSAELSNGARNKRVGIVGLLPDSQLYTLLDRTGRRIILPARGVVLSSKLAEILGVKTGDTIRFRPLIGTRRITEAPVVAVSDMYIGLSAFADIEYLGELIGEDVVAHRILARLYTRTMDDRFVSEVKEYRPVVGLDERLRAQRQLNATFGETSRTMIFMTIFFAGLIAFGSVFNSALINLSERRREVGTLRVLGYTPGQISTIFAGESFLLNGIGVLAGLAGGIALSHVLSQSYSSEFFQVPVILRAGQFLLVGMAMLLFVVAAQLIIYRMVRRFDWLSVLNIKE